MSKQPYEDETAKMDWRAVRQILQKPQTRGEQISQQEKNLREYFGDEHFRELRELAEPVRAQATREELGNVVLLPGIMGSHLSVVESDGDRVVVAAELSSGATVCATFRGTFVAVGPDHPAFARW